MANDEQKDEEQKDQQKDEENKEKKDDPKLEDEQKKDDGKSENEDKKDVRKSEKSDQKTFNKMKSKEYESEIKKIPVTKLRVAQSTLTLESTSEDSFVYEKTDKNIQKYQMYLGGFSKDQARKKYNDEVAKARREKWARERALIRLVKEKEAREAKIKHKLLGKKHDEKLLPVTDRRKVKLLHDGTYEEFDEDNLVYYHNPRTRVYLILVFIFTEAFGIAFLTLVPVYSILESKTIDIYLEKGYRRKGKTIHYTLGALWVFIFGNGFIIFRITSAYKLTVLKWVHALIYAVSMPLPLYCVNSYYNVKEENADINVQEHFYSLHSFLGFVAIYLYIFEIFCGCIVYTLFYFRQVHRNLYYQVHTYVALLGFILAVSAFSLGITMEEFDIKIKASTPEAEVAAYLFLSGAFVCLFAVLALFLIINPDFDVEKDLPLTMKS